jgi:hypothetical protein
MRRALLVTLAALAASVATAPAASAVPPQISPTCVGVPSCDRWFTGDVRLRWNISGGAPVAGCQDLVIRDDTPPGGRRYDCTAQQTDPPYDAATAYVTMFRDATAPLVTDAQPERPPDRAGWYNRPIAFIAHGSDATSGIRSCVADTYGGPDSFNATIVATCRDIAGNSASRVFGLRYDATPPDLSAATISTGDRVVRVSWAAGSTATLMRTPGPGASASAIVYDGQGAGFADREVRNKRQYRYVLTLTDEAGNAASREFVVIPRRQLLEPTKRAIVNAPPLLRWTPVRGARYYNVQLFRGGRKILSAWPRRAELQLKERWRYRGRRYRLVDGRYHWYVWPGEGPRAARRYGDRIGARSFVLDR